MGIAEQHWMRSAEGTVWRDAASRVAEINAENAERQDLVRAALRRAANENVSPGSGRLLVEVAGIKLFVDGRGIPVNMPSASGATL